MKFIISTDIESALPQAIDFNFEQLKAELEDRLSYYNALIVTEDSIKAGKADRATLNKLKIAIDDKRKEVKNQFLAPYESFEIRCKELTKMLDGAIGSIDTQVKAFEDAEKNDKRTAIEQFYAEHAEELTGLVSISKLWDSKWLNKSEPLAKITTDIEAKIAKVRNDIKVIRAMRLECEELMLDAYLNTLDMSAALAEKSRFEQRQEAMRQATEYEKKKVTQETQQVEQQAEQQAEPSVRNEDTKTIRVEFYNTTAAFRADMKLLCCNHGIKYGGIK